jgi:hypothetical protein
MSGWCTFAKLAGWVGIVLAVSITFLVYKAWTLATPQSKDTVLNGLKISVGITVTFIILQYLLFRYPEYCQVIGMIMGGLILLSIVTGFIHGKQQ